jgi:hypothetical protein
LSATDSGRLSAVVTLHESDSLVHKRDRLQPVGGLGLADPRRVHVSSGLLRSISIEAVGARRPEFCRSGPQTAREVACSGRRDGSDAPTAGELRRGRAPVGRQAPLGKPPTAGSLGLIDLNSTARICTLGYVGLKFC